jgi:hypothetical protein
MLEGKKHMRARAIRSPDEWDAIALTFAEPVKAPPVAIRADPRPPMYWQATVAPRGWGPEREGFLPLKVLSTKLAYRD